MKKIILSLLTVLMLTLSGNLSVFAFTIEDMENMGSITAQGYSCYFVSIAKLQKDRMEAESKEAVPSKIKTFWNHVIWGDFCAPTQEFGYYEISPRD